jgi:hypothetical protein
MINGSMAESAAAAPPEALPIEIEYSLILKRISVLGK